MSSDDAPPPSDSPPWKSSQRSAMQALSLILGPLPDPITSSPSPALSLLSHDSTALEISRRLRQPGSGAGGDDLCRWLYDTFQSTDPDLQLAVLLFVPTLAGIYLSRAAHRMPLAGFEAVLLALYAHETLARGGEPQTVKLPNPAAPSLYYDGAASTKPKSKSAAAVAVTDSPLNVALLSPTLEPHGTVRATKRARIVGVALELYYSKISQMSASSKLEFCEFCVAWSGQDRTLRLPPAEQEVPKEKEESSGDGVDESGEKGGRIPLPWELFQPVLRIVGHCLLGVEDGGEEVKTAAMAAVWCLHARAMHDMSPQAVLATRSLIRLGSIAPESVWDKVGSTVAGDSPRLEAGRVSV